MEHAAAGHGDEQQDDAADAADYAPAGLRGVIAVGATDELGGLAGYSNFGPRIDLLGPGGRADRPESGILSTTYKAGPSAQWGYFFLPGTSQAAAHVSGVAALLRAIAPQLQPEAPLRAEPELQAAPPVQTPPAAPAPTAKTASRAVEVARALGQAALLGASVGALVLLLLTATLSRTMAATPAAGPVVSGPVPVDTGPVWAGLFGGLAVAAAGAALLWPRRRPPLDADADAAAGSDEGARRERVRRSERTAEDLKVRRLRIARAARKTVAALAERLEVLQGTVLDAREHAREELRRLGVKAAAAPAEDDYSELLEKEAPLHRALLRPEALPGLWERSQALRDPEIWASELLQRAWQPRWLRWSAEIARQGAFVKAGIPTAQSLTADLAATLPGNPIAIPTPGHTGGHCSYVFGDVLVAGDAVITGHPVITKGGPQLLPQMFNHDQEACERSLSALGLLDTQVLLPGHGPAWRGPVREAAELALQRS